MRIDILTLFPEMFNGVLGSSILKRASQSVADPAHPTDASRVRPPVVDYVLHNIRDYTRDKHGKVDKPPFGGGPGMVMQCQPVWDAVQAVESEQADTPPIRVLFTPKGQRLTQEIAEQISQCPRLMLICGHYEGFDQRVINRLHQEKGSVPFFPSHQEKHQEKGSVPFIPSGEGDGLLELSIGDYVLTGGELPAMVLIDAIVRLLPGALGDETSAHDESFSANAQRQLDYPHYTRPQTWDDRGVPPILLSGDHARIAAWRQAQRQDA